ncbi:MAG: acetolactate synthase large subunit [Leptospiraceae bacterium]|nr:acetolactate synthase large subunit [Leptospiraceae bacterium]
MNGAHALMQTLLEAGVDTCFTNPGTSEMHFVAALDDTDMRGILTLFEGVASGAADGYGRMADKPAATLLHLGCGLGNGLANLHNARKGRVPIVNIIGDHATAHVQYDAQLQSDIETVARNVSSWIRSCTDTKMLASDAAAAVAAAKGPPGQVASLILPADVSWGEEAESAAPHSPVPPPIAAAETIDQVAAVLQSGQKTAILLGGRVLRAEGLRMAAQIAEKTGAKLFCEVFPSRLERGAGLPHVERIAYLAEMAAVQLAGFKNLILMDAKAPVSFFAYPGKKSYLVPEGCTPYELAAPNEDALQSLAALVSKLDANAVEPQVQAERRPKLPRGQLSAAKVCQAIGALLPERAIISDEAQTSGVKLPLFTAGAPRHDVLTLTGGAIGQGLPVAVGAAVASPDRPVLALVGDGAAMYTIQSLWTMQRENLDVTVIIMNNRSYAILNIELQRVGAKSIGPKAKDQLDLASPALDFCALAQGMGVPGRKAETAEDFNAALEWALAEKGPHLIDAIVPTDYKGLRLKALPFMLASLDKIPNSVAKKIKKALAP